MYSKSFFLLLSLLISLSSCYADGYVTSITIHLSKSGNADISSLCAGDTFKVRDSIYSLTDTSVNRMTSEHFQIIYGNGDTTHTITDAYIKGNLINLENIRTFYINKLGMKDISTSRTGQLSGQYKLNMYVSATGLTIFEDDWAYMSVDSQGFAYLFVAPGAMRVDEPSWVIPHELAHAFTYHQGGSVPGAWYESTANWFRDQYLGSEYYAYGNNVYGPTSDFFAPYLLNAQYYVPRMLNWYDTWPIFLYITENPDNINGLGLSLMHRLFENGSDGSNMYQMIENFSGVSIKTIMGGLTKRLATFDFSRRNAYLKHLNEEVLTQSGNKEKIYTTLNNKDSSGYQSVPTDKAPMQAGFNIIPLTNFGKNSISIDFVSTGSAQGTDFRVTIVTLSYSGITRYSETISSGQGQLYLQGDESAAYIVVCATPDTFKDYYVDWNSQATDTDTRYPYKIKITTS